MKIIREKGILPIAAIGNEGQHNSRSPGNYHITSEKALSVGSCNKDDEVSDFSGSQIFGCPEGPFVPDLVAPGEEVLSFAPGGQYNLVMDGTSMATPHVAGLAALLMSAKPGISVHRVEQAILDSCQRSQSMQRDRANRGMPDAVNALNLI